MKNLNDFEVNWPDLVTDALLWLAVIVISCWLGWLWTLAFAS